MKLRKSVAGLTVGLTALLFAGQVSALASQPGTLLWSRDTGSGTFHAIYSSPAIDSDGVVYCGSNENYNNQVRAINGHTGVQIWQIAMANSADLSPAVGPNNLVYAGDTWAGYLNAIDKQSGNVLWQFSRGGGFGNGPGFGSPALASDGTVYVTCASLHTLYAVDGNTGAENWSFGTGVLAASYSPSIGRDKTVFLRARKTLWDNQGRSQSLGVVHWQPVH